MMLLSESFLPALAPDAWAVSDEQQALVTSVTRFAHERLEPLLMRAPDEKQWQETRALASRLELGTLILPERMGGMAIRQHDLALITEAFAAGPLERAAELTLSSVALMTLRACDALDILMPRSVLPYFDGSVCIALGIPDSEADSLWVLREHRTGPAMLIEQGVGAPHLVLADGIENRDGTPPATAAVLGALSLERYCATPVLLAPRPIGSVRGGMQGADAPQTWLIQTCLYLGALLSGAMLHSVRFALQYGTTRRAFRKPIGSHQLVAARLADMLTSAHSAHLFVRAASSCDTAESLPLVRQMAHHVAEEAMNISRELVQLCGAHGYVEGLPPAARFQTMHWFALLLKQVENALAELIEASPHDVPGGEPK